ncbi:MAG: BREX-1 system phosphatase PglZ type B [Luteolibacter sp.]
MAAHDSRQKLAGLEKQHAARRQWVWAKLGEAPLAQALAFLHTLGEATRSVPSFSTLAEFSAWYAETGWLADIAALDALQSAGADDGAVRLAIRSVYLPWLEEVCSRFQQLSASGLPVEPGLAVAEGECLLFVDGLRLDLARRLAEQLEQRHLTLDFQTRYSALPTVTATAKPAVSPISGKLAGDKIPPDFQPNGPDGKPLTSQRFTKLLQDAHVEKVDESNPAPAGPDSRGWCETGRIDSRGHDLGAELALHLPAELSRVVALVERLFAAGWQSARIVTDHGWLLMPGGLDKYDLPGYLVESRWSRCACIKGESVPNSPTVAWRWNPAEHLAVASGAKSFKGGVEYSHGGVSPQECVLPVITIRPTGGGLNHGAPKIASVKWKRQRCTVEISNPTPGLKVDVRRNGSDPTSSVAASIKEVEPDGLVSLLVTDESLEGKPVTLVLLSPANEPIAKADTVVGY